ncbi:hypothetical protein [Peribacillus glennii]|uniref:Uncharacterized protein n=1 Tax=Peribacillus glennii TaxID=2303991 RepID=A0A372LFE5_9BACI|nr:hypothetical protein [Peribacillus glennii]RFU65031.1 hypothetical protein D0466_03715 [Peribacillus glennii]
MEKVTEMYVHTAVKVQKPGWIEKLERKEGEQFAFDQTIFTDYVINDDKESSLLSINQKEECFFITCFKVGSLSELKLARQVFIPEYLDSGLRYPLIEKMNHLGLTPISEGFDKAYAHVSVFIKDIRSLSPFMHSRFANADGDDDPVVIDKLNYISNFYNQKETRFVTGAESLSFSTISENEQYFYGLHLPKTGILYLKYYLYYLQHDQIPSKQMMPRLLGNLWRSMQSNRNDFNKHLYKTMSIDITRGK